MSLHGTIRVATVFLFLSSVLVQGSRRVIRVRKTGEFGRRLPSLSTVYEPPRQSFDQLHTAQSRRPDQFNVGIKKPSQQLELPSFPTDNHHDSEPAETGDSIQGYVYPNPSTPPQLQGFKDFQPLAVSTKGSGHAGIPEYTSPEEPEQQEVDAPPENASPGKEAEYFVSASNPLGAEKMDAEGERQTPTPASPKPVQAQAEQTKQCDEHDHDCWPHGYEGVIPGTAGVDFPILNSIVETPFDCENVDYSGYYADTDERSRCQIFHVCLKGNGQRKVTQKWSFLCPNGTVFSQGDFVCVWWNNAPECNEGVVGELALRNAELGWDNLTEVETRSKMRGSIDVDSFSSMKLRSGSGSSRSDTKLKPDTPTAPSRKSKTNLLPPTPTRTAYRVPVKENARTKLKEVTNNGLEGAQVSEESSVAASSRQQSEYRASYKSGSSLLQSESEAYEQKSVSDSVAPFVGGNRGGALSSPLQPLPGRGSERYVDEELVSNSLATPPPPSTASLFQNPREEQSRGYRYPRPRPASALVSTPAPTYLPPPFSSSRIKEAPSITDYPPTTTTTSAVTEFATDKESHLQAQIQTTTSTSANFEGSSGTPEAEYVGESSTEFAGGNGLTSTDSLFEEYVVTNTSPTEQSQGYNFDTSTTPQVLFDTTTTKAEGLGEGETGANPPRTYLPPPPPSSSSSQAIRANNNGTDLSITEDYPDLSTPNIVGEGATGGGYSTIPTTPTGLRGTEDNSNLDVEEKMSRILEEIQKGGAEVRDENGNKLGYEELQKLILSTPNGLLSLQKAEEESTTDSGATEIPTTERNMDGESGGGGGGGYLSNLKQPDYEVSTPTKEFNTNNVEEAQGFRVASLSPPLMSGDGDANYQTPTSISSSQNPFSLISQQGYYQTPQVQGPMVGEQLRGRLPEPQVNFLRPSTTQQFYQSDGQMNRGREDNSYQTQSQSSTGNPTQSQLYYQTQSPAMEQYFQGQRLSNEYLPPAAPTRDLTNQIQLQKSQTLPFSPQILTSAPDQRRASSIDINVVPALLVDSQTKVEHNYGRESGYNNLRQVAEYGGPPFISQSNTFPIRVPPPRLNPFTTEDALPKKERFTAQEGQTAQGPSQEQSLVGGFYGGRGFLNLPSNDQNPLSSSPPHQVYYPGKDNSIGINLTYERK